MKIVRAFGMGLGLPRQAQQSVQELADLTTAPQRAAGTIALDALHIAPPKEFWTPLEAPVPGLLVRGTLPDDHAARFLLRLPRDWNGKLVVAAASGITDEHTYDLYFSDYLLSRGYAFGATDKAMRRAVLDDTVLVPQTEESSVRLWHSRLEALAVLAKEVCARHRGRAPEAAFAVGLSNGGYVARRAAEAGSGLFDGALEISGVLWRACEGNLLRQLPAALRATVSTPWDRGALAAAGFPRAGGRWDAVLSLYREVYWEPVMHLFLGDLDPDFHGAVADYDLDARPSSVREAIASFQNTGDLTVPLVSIAGVEDLLISCAGHGEAYCDLVRRKGKEALHRFIRVPDACHIDTNRESFPFAAPLMPAAHQAFEELVRRVAGATAPSSRRRR